MVHAGQTVAKVTQARSLAIWIPRSKLNDGALIDLFECFRGKAGPPVLARSSPESSPANEAAGEGDEGAVEFGAALPADSEAFELVEQGLLDAATELARPLGFVGDELFSRWLDQDLHRPPPLRGHRRPPHVRRQYHRNRHQLLPRHHPGARRTTVPELRGPIEEARKVRTARSGTRDTG